MNKWNKWKFSVRELSSNIINNSIHFNSEECTNLCKSETAKNCVGIYKLENFFFLNQKCDFLYSFFKKIRHIEIVIKKQKLWSII